MMLQTPADVDMDTSDAANTDRGPQVETVSYTQHNQSGRFVVHECLPAERKSICCLLSQVRLWTIDNNSCRRGQPGSLGPSQPASGHSASLKAGTTLPKQAFSPQHALLPHRMPANVRLLRASMNWQHLHVTGLVVPLLVDFLCAHLNC